MEVPILKSLLAPEAIGSCNEKFSELCNYILLLIRGSLKTPQTAMAIHISLACPLELQDNTLLMKTSHTLCEHGQIRLELS